MWREIQSWLATFLTKAARICFQLAIEGCPVLHGDGPIFLATSKAVREVQRAGTRLPLGSLEASEPSGPLPLPEVEEFHPDSRRAVEVDVRAISLELAACKRFFIWFDTNPERSETINNTATRSLIQAPWLPRIRPE